MSPIKRLMCLFDQHEPIRHEAHWQGKTFVGTCRHCGAEIERISQGNWKRRKLSKTPTEVA